MAEHPLRAEIELWASDPKYWVWQAQGYDNVWTTCRVQRPFPPEAAESGFVRLVPRPWLENPEKWEVWRTSKMDRSLLRVTKQPEWNHKLYTYELSPRRRMARIESAEFPAPETEAPGLDDRYWIPCSTDKNLAPLMFWRGDGHDRRYLERGLVHLSEENALAHAKAMLEMTLC